MIRPILLSALVSAVFGCAGNRSEAAGARIHDTTVTARDTVNPNDTLPRSRDSVPDSTGH